VVGRATHAILLWRLEKGERIEILDTLATSTSLTSTVTSQLQLRQISVFSVPLLVIWVLSPLGGQASIRQMSVGTAIITTPSEFHYTVPAGKFPQIGLTSLTPIVNTFYTGALAASLRTKESPVDAWGNVKIPKIERYENKQASDSDLWYDSSMDDDNDLAKYSSNVGIPMDGFQSGTTTTDYEMNLQTMYTQLACTSYDNAENTDPYKEIPSDARNVTGYGGLIWWSENQLRGRFNESPETLKPMNFSYLSGNEYHSTRVISCMMTSSYVEAEVSCAANSTCRVIKLRRSQLPHLPPSFTMMDVYAPGATFRVPQTTNWDLFAEGFALSFGIEDPGGSSAPDQNIVDRYLEDPSLTPVNPFLRYSATIPPSDEAFSDRFGQLLNTYVACINNLFTITGVLNENTSYSWDNNATFVPPQSSGPDGNGFWSKYNWSGERTAMSQVWSTEGRKHEHIEVIMVHKPWTIILSIASLVLIAVSIVPPLVRHFLTTGPNIAMNFSSLATRNNLHVPIPTSGSFLPAADRFRLLKDLRLRFADAESKSDVGNLVIAAQGVGTREYSRVRKGRLYE
jgi:hypothetical protein